MLSLYLVIGAFAGLMAGLLGVGGGIVVIPALSTLFLHYGSIPPTIAMQVTVGTSLAIMIVTSLSSLYAHAKHQAVQWEMAKRMSVGLIIGVIVGSVLARFLASAILQGLFGVFLLIVAGQMLIGKREHGHRLPHFSARLIFNAALLIGLLSSLLGIGGGTLIVPFLLLIGLDMHQATGTSVACGLCIGLVATVCFMTTGLFSTIHIPSSTGYIYWPAFVGISLSSVLFAPIGAHLSHTLPTAFLKRIFGVFLLLMACDMLFALKSSG